MISKAHVGYCKQCNHYALIHEDNNGRCIPCACWDTVRVQRHHDMNGLQSISNRMLPVEKGKACPYCST